MQGSKLLSSSRQQRLITKVGTVRLPTLNKALRHRTEFMYAFKVSIFSVTVDLSLLVVIAEYFSALPFVISISQLKFQWENWQFTSIAMISLDKPSRDPLLYIYNFWDVLKVTFSPTLHGIILKSSWQTAWLEYTQVGHLFGLPTNSALTKVKNLFWPEHRNIMTVIKKDIFGQCYHLAYWEP